MSWTVQFDPIKNEYKAILLKYPKEHPLYRNMTVWVSHDKEVDDYQCRIHNENGDALYTYPTKEGAKAYFKLFRKNNCCIII
jgi:hypothetical protein